MAITFIRDVITSGYNLSKINSNFEKIQTALQDAVSRSGTTPNQINSDLDMNNNDIINIKTLNVRDISVNSQNVTGILERATEAAEAAEGFAEEASQYAELAKNNWSISGPYTGTGLTSQYLLTTDPGSIYNMFVVVDGVTQLSTDNAYQLVYVGTLPYIQINVPAGIIFEVRTGNAVPLSVPVDGGVTTNKIADLNVTEVKLASDSVSTAKIANDAVTFDKTQNIATARVLGRVTASSGNIEELTAAQIRDSFLPAGSIVDSVSAVYTTNADLSAVIPVDDTIPQITEGVEILSASITPKSTTNKLRIRFRGEAVINGTAPVNLAWAIFNGNADAIRAGVVTVSVTGCVNTLFGEVEYTPGTLSAQTISVRVGGDGTPLVRFNGSLGGRLLGGAAGATLIVEEIKA